MKLKNNLLLIISLVFILLSTSSLFAQEKKINKKELPQAVLNSFQKDYPNATIKAASIENENGKIYYEIESLEGRKS